MRSLPFSTLVSTLVCAAAPSVTFARAHVSHESAGELAGELAEVLEAARAASGHAAWSASGRGLAFSGDALLAEVESSFELFFGAGGRYRFDLDGPLGQSTVWDGSAARVREGRGPLMTLTHEARDEQRLPQWVHSGFWSHADAPLRIAFSSEENRADEPSEDYVSLHLSFEDTTTSATLRLARDTWLPEAMIRTGGSGDSVLRFGDYRKVSGVPIAHHIVSEEGGLVGSLTLREARAVDATSERFTLPEGPATDVRFGPEIAPEVEVRRVRSGHLMVHPLVDGEDHGWFIFDSGAGRSCIDPEVAEKLGLELFGAVPAVGVGGTVRAGLRQGESFSLGPVEISDPVFVEIELGFLEPIFGVPVAGICGYDLFARSVLELDLEEPALSIHDPATYELEQGRWDELVLDGRLPCIRGAFEGHTGLFKIDTGDAGTVTFYGPAVERLKLLEGRELGKIQIGGVGGFRMAHSGEIEWIELGGRRFEAVDATFSQLEEGAFTDESVLGSLGGALLGDFRVVFDYSGARIALVPLDD